MTALKALPLLALATVLLLAADARAQSCLAPPSDLLGWWSMDEATGQLAADLSTHDRHGTLTGTTSVPGVVGNARRFGPGYVDKLQVDGSGSLDVTGNQITMAAWLKLEPHDGVNQIFTAFFGKNVPNGQPYIMGFEGGKVGGVTPLPTDRWRFEYILTNASGTRVHNQSTGVDVLVDGQFHHYAMTYDGSQVRLWVDAVLQGSFNFSGNLRQRPADLVTMTAGVGCSVDEAQIFGRALSAAELAAIVQAGAAGQCKPDLGPAVECSPVIGTWTTARSPRILGLDADLSVADAAIVTSFPGASYVRLAQLTPANLADLDVLVLDTVDPTPLTAAEQAALSGFVQDGGTVLAHVFSAGANFTAATAVVAPFGLTAVPTQNGGAAVSHPVSLIGDPVIQGPHGTVGSFVGKYENHLAVSASGAISLASDAGGTVLALLPRGVHGSGQVLFFTNYFSFMNPTTSFNIAGHIQDGGNRALLLNLIASSLMCDEPADTDPPVVSITAPADGLVTGALAVTVTADIADAGTTTVTSSPAGVAPDTLPAGGGPVSGELALALEGENVLGVSAEDAAGNPGATSILVYRDTAAPAIAISPAEGTVVSTPIPSFGITVTDQTLTQVFIGGDLVGTALVENDDVYGSATVMLTGSIALWTEGGNSIEVVAIDAAGNQTSVTRTVILDSTAPLVTITQPANGACYPLGSATTVALAADIDDASATEVTGALTGSLPAGGGTLLGAFDLVEGVNVITVTATDNGGFGNPASDTVSVTLDTIAPTVVISSPADGACVRGTIDFGATATDVLPGTVESTRYFVDGVLLPAAGLYEVDTTALTDGLHELRVDATDSCGNLASASRTVLVDNTAPTVTLDDPLDLAWVAGTIAFDGSAADGGSGLASISMRAAGAAPDVDGSRTYATPVAADAVSSLVDTLAASGGVDGDLELEVTAVDCAGNSATVAITVRVDNTAPGKLITSPADGSVVRCDLRVESDVDDANLASVQYVIDGVPQDVLYAPPYLAEFDTRTRLDGELSITLLATDLAGNLSSCTIHVTVDNLDVAIQPNTLQLKSKGGDKSVTVKVEGQSAGLLEGLEPGQVTLSVPGGSPVPATLIDDYHAGWGCNEGHQPSHRGHRKGHGHGEHGHESRVRLKFDRKLLIGALRAAGLHGAVEVTLKVTQDGEVFVIGSDVIKVKS